MKKLFYLLLLLTLAPAHAAKIEDVQVLDLKFEKGSLVAKLHLKESKTGAYFTVQIGKDDEKALEKIALLLKKAKEKDAFKLAMNIPSFSPQSGSFYRSNYVTFTGSAEGESLLPE